MGRSALDVVEISSDEEEEEAEAEEGSRPRKLVMLCPRLGWMLEVFADVVAVRDEPAPQALPPQQKKKGKPHGVRAGGDGGGGGDDDDDDDDDCVVLDGDPDRPVAVAGGGKGSAAGCGSNELEIVAEKGQIACRDFPHSRHLCSQFSFNTTPHVKHCSMCYCFVCDAPAPCKYWGNGLTIDDHCHATDKETKWKALRQAFKCKNLPASHPEKHQNVVYPTMSSPRQQVYEEYTSDEEYYEPDVEATLYVGNLPHDIDDKYLAQLFKNVGIVEFSEILYNRETGQSRGSGYVTMSTVEEAEMAVKTFHRRELHGKFMTVEMQSPHQHRSPVRIFVGNLPCEVDGSMLKLLFSEYGQVVDTKVAYGYVRGVWSSRRFGFVTMATREESDDAICYLHRRIWKGCKLRVEVAKGVPRQDS